MAGFAVNGTDRAYNQQSGLAVVFKKISGKWWPGKISAEAGTEKKKVIVKQCCGVDVRGNAKKSKSNVKAIKQSNPL